MTSTLSPAQRTTARPPRSDPPWARLALAGLLVATAVLYLWGLGASGWANSFYSAAVQAGTQSWKAFFFGSSDAANAITVDKTPLALWPMELSARIFGVGPWSILVPQALMGVATVGVLYAAVRRRFGAAAGLLAGAALALTPVAALMFRFNNPDALLTLLLTLGAYALLRAQENASTRWLMLAASCVGFGFLAKMFQAFLVVPVFALVYLVLAPTPVRRRLWQLLAAGAVMLASAGWWVAVVALVPASARPYIGGSQHNSVLELAFGYNGLGRLSGDETGGLGNTNQDAGWTRMFGPEPGGQIAWLLPTALLLLLAGIWLTRRTPRTDPRRAALAVWGGWLLVTATTFSLMQGIFHPYYTVVLAPATAALTGMGAALLWQNRTPTAPRGVVPPAPATAPGRPAGSGVVGPAPATTLGGPTGSGVVPPAPATAPGGPASSGVVGPAPAGLGAAFWGRRYSVVLAVVVVVTAWWSYVLLGRAPDFLPWLRMVVLIGGLAAAVALLVPGRLSARIAAVAAAVAVAVSLAGPAAYAINTASTPHAGAIPSAGPSAGFGPGRGGPMGTHGPNGRRGPRQANPGAPSQANPGAPGRANPGAPGQSNPGAPGQSNQGAPRQGNQGMPGRGNPGNSGPGNPAMPGQGNAGGPRFGGRPGGMGGARALLDATKPGAALTALLKRDGGSYRWPVATVGSNSAAGYQLATGEPTMAIGGFNGTDPAPTLGQFQRYVADGRIHYLIAGSSMMRGNTDTSEAQRITAWVQANFTAKTVDGVQLYDLTTRAG